jgi:galactokinase
LNFIIEQCLHNKNIIGAKMTGGGLGGCVIAIAKNDGVHDFNDEMQNAFSAKFDLQCNIYTLQSDNGVGEVI